LLYSAQVILKRYKVMTDSSSPFAWTYYRQLPTPVVLPKPTMYRKKSHWEREAGGPQRNITLAFDKTLTSDDPFPRYRIHSDPPNWPRPQQ
jgi:hypothetical protein